MPTRIPATVGSLDGSGAADNDLPYAFGRLPSARVPFPFSTRQLARLLILRGRVRADFGEHPAFRDYPPCELGSERR